MFALTGIFLWKAETFVLSADMFKL